MNNKAGRIGLAHFLGDLVDPLVRIFGFMRAAAFAVRCSPFADGTAKSIYLLPPVSLANYYSSSSISGVIILTIESEGWLLKFEDFKRQC